MCSWVPQPSRPAQQRTETGLKLEPTHRRGGFCSETNQAGTAKTETLTSSGEFWHQLDVQSTQHEPCLFMASSLQQDFWDTSFVAGISSSLCFIPKSHSMVYTASRLSFQLLRNIRVVQVLGFCEQSCWQLLCSSLCLDMTSILLVKHTGRERLTDGCVCWTFLHWQCESTTSDHTFTNVWHPQFIFTILTFSKSTQWHLAWF